jgi:single-strand DNA-binding protein
MAASLYRWTGLTEPEIQFKPNQTKPNHRKEMRMDKVILIGRLGADPEGAYTQDGNFVAHFSVACLRYNVGAPIWYRITAFGKLGESCHQHLKQGRRVYVEGRLEYDEKTGGPRIYNRKNGQSGAAFEVVATLVEFLDWKDSKESKEKSKEESKEESREKAPQPDGFGA